MKNRIKASRCTPARCSRTQSQSGRTVQASTTSTHHQTANTVSSRGALTRGVFSTRDQSLPNSSTTAHQKCTANTSSDEVQVMRHVRAA